MIHLMEIFFFRMTLRRLHSSNALKALIKEHLKVMEKDGRRRGE